MGGPAPGHPQHHPDPGDQRDAAHAGELDDGDGAGRGPAGADVGLIPRQETFRTTIQSPYSSAKGVQPLELAEVDLHVPSAVKPLSADLNLNVLKDTHAYSCF